MPLRTLDFRAPAACKVEIAGREIGPLYPFLLELQVDTNRRDAAVATLTLESRRNERGRWTVQDADVFVPWRPIVISAVFGLRQEEIMRGYIRELRATYPEDCNSRVVVECQDESLVLDRRHRRRVWGAGDVPNGPVMPTSDRAILASLLAEHGLTMHPEKGYRQHFTLLRNALGDNINLGVGSQLSSGLSAALASIL